MTQVRIIFATDSLNAAHWLAEEVRAGLTNGDYYNGNGCYYDAGSVEVDAEVEYVGEDARIDYGPILRAAFDASQNDAIENEVVGYAGGMPKLAPAKWNGQFSQRSSQPGDLFVIEQLVFKAEGDGFRFVCGSLRALDRVRGVKLGRNPNAINEDFDSLITD